MPEETDLLGEWEVVGGVAVADATCKRIDTLVEQILQEVEVAKNGWDILYRDSEDGRYWELTYPHSSWHGGGPPRLTYLTTEEAKAKYRQV